MPEESKECNHEFLLLLGNWPFDDSQCPTGMCHARLRCMTHRRDLIPDHDVLSLILHGLATDRFSRSYTTRVHLSFRDNASIFS